MHIFLTSLSFQSYPCFHFLYSTFSPLPHTKKQESINYKLALQLNERVMQQL